MTIYLDTVHATNLKNIRFIEGHIAIMVGAAITYGANWHQIVSTSSTEADFIQATSAANMAKYLRIILVEL
eukprot:1942946-Ditylum_brightwellii.AAC.1